MIFLPCNLMINFIPVLAHMNCVQVIFVCYCLDWSVYFFALSVSSIHLQVYHVSFFFKWITILHITKFTTTNGAYLLNTFKIYINFASLLLTMLSKWLWVWLSSIQAASSIGIVINKLNVFLLFNALFAFFKI